MRQAGQPDLYVGRRYGEFKKLHKRLRTELPGKVLPPLPRKNKSSTSSTWFGGDDDASSVSSVSTQGTTFDDVSPLKPLHAPHKRNVSLASGRSRNSGESSRDPSREPSKELVTLYREEQRVSLRAFLRTFLQNEQIANSKAMKEFLTKDPIKLNDEERYDLQKRKDMDEKRIEEQKKFYEIARQRAKELDVYMERFRRDIVESSLFSLYTVWLHTKHAKTCIDGLSKLFAEIREKDKIDDLSVEYKKFAEWLRIE